jgi:YD repeat-containing protein
MSIDRYLNSDYTESWEYDGKQYLLSHTDTLGLKTKYTSYNSRALPEKVQVLDGNDVVESTLTYDPGTGFPTSKTTKVGSQTLSTEFTTYDLRGFLREEKTLSPQGPVLSKTQYEYFADGKLFKSIDGKGVITEHRYNAARNLAGTKVAAGLQYPNHNSPASTSVGQDVEYSYYSDGSLKQTKDSINNRVLSVNYYQHGANLVSSSGSYFGTRSWITTPNVAGAIDASGQPTTNQVDAYRSSRTATFASIDRPELKAPKLPMLAAVSNSLPRSAWTIAETFSTKKLGMQHRKSIRMTS